MEDRETRNQKTKDWKMQDLAYRIWKLKDHDVSEKGAHKMSRLQTDY